MRSCSRGGPLPGAQLSGIPRPGPARIVKPRAACGWQQLGVFDALLPAYERMSQALAATSVPHRRLLVATTLAGGRRGRCALALPGMPVLTPPPRAGAVLLARTMKPPSAMPARSQQELVAELQGGSVLCCALAAGGRLRRQAHAQRRAAQGRAISETSALWRPCGQWTASCSCTPSWPRSRRTGTPQGSCSGRACPLRG